ncbi:hypothetical protein DFQ04_2359 [Algoriphagus boseongensis]|uniref:Uncharacterized protein n=1 Tax=Algoriphagus boseongensis TaxID=1442587 RepID=A0A4R6T3L8_9BACT|nr:hypothetical protein [Algoriphagus boseongensis]TDQ16247.1 hypothetical protein DFQ04_2359 [Algoriphagus boseongensis]
METTRNIILTLVLFLNSILSFGQEHEKDKMTEGLLSADSTWSKELFQFPISFAPEIKFQGKEVALFPKGWGNSESQVFWSYAFVWEIDAEDQLIKSTLEDNLELYFDGLLSIETWQKNDPTVLKTNAFFEEKNRTKNTSAYLGKIKIFESRYTKKPLTLNVTIEQYFCEQPKKAIILFKFSPKEFDHKTWEKLNEVKVLHGVCEN